MSGAEVDPVTLARAAWSRVAEPGDLTAGAVIAALGPVDALAWLRDAARAGDSQRGAGGPVVGIDPVDLFDDGADHHPAGRADDRAGGLGGASRRRLAAAVGRWAPRLEGLDPLRELRVLARLGGVVVHPGTPGWPTALADLGPAAPPCLWVRGDAAVDAAVARSVALVGSRAATAYGEHVAAELAAGVADRGFTVVSGGAYGVDAAAHRGAIAGGGRTVVFLAGGVDRPYPAGNAALLARVLETGGSVVSEVPPGSVPSRTRFLQRNRLIAAAAVATVVVEAAWRSGALNTAGHAAGLLRPVGAVPGPVTSMASAGCHRLLREGVAVCVTDAGEVAELAGAGADLAPARAEAAAEVDGLGLAARQVLDALPVRRAAGTDSLARAAGLSIAQVNAALGPLELAGLAERDGPGWRRRARAARP
ncbi:DNA-processing protein DprA [Pengzhenrongella sicca]|uniref:DNA-processing protein DprA n=1 Tax=Pengzhenrongella sicca TaxID=2819238 RepID=A0A8A4ZF88_9MICO|nr:DNA-processing protein DprA [Pengzhenrongella sicca]QTE30554.1 DNA-processing protein DprA [Pengzhenrongella sicca]